MVLLYIYCTFFQTTEDSQIERKHMVYYYYRFTIGFSWSYGCNEKETNESSKPKGWGFWGPSAIPILTRIFRRRLSLSQLQQWNLPDFFLDDGGSNF